MPGRIVQDHASKPGQVPGLRTKGLGIRDHELTTKTRGPIFGPGAWPKLEGSAEQSRAEQSRAEQRY
jgi:hypothetical protein